MTTLTAEQMSTRLDHLAELETHLSFRISRLSKLLDTHSAAQLTGTGLNLTWYRILLVLQIFKETTAADLSRLMVLDRAQISRAAADLIAAGYVVARPDPSSKRKKLLSLTDSGHLAVNGALGRFQDRQAVLEAQLSAEDLRGLSESIDKLSEYLAQDLNAPEAAPTRFARR